MKDNLRNRSKLMKILVVAAVAFTFVQSTFCQTSSFYEMPRGGWKANPTFFEATNDTDRRNAILLWFYSISYESWQESGRRTDIDHPSGTMGAIRQYAVPGFQGIFGKRFTELTKSDKKLIVKWLKKCSNAMWVTYGLVQPLTQPEDYPQVKEWVAQFENQKAPARSLRDLGSATHSINTPNAKALVYEQANGLFRIELFTSVYGYTNRRSTLETTKVASSLLVVNENGKVIKQEMGRATVTVYAMSREGEKIIKNQDSIMVDTYSEKGKLYLFLGELYCRWGIWMTTLTEYENCAEVGGGRIGQSINGITADFLNNELKTLRLEVPVGQEIRHEGWVGIRIR